MGPCLRKLLTSQEDQKDKEDSRTSEFIVPIAEVSRKVAASSSSALVITHSHFKLSAIALGENKNNAALLPQSGEEDFSPPMKAEFAYDCKLFTWPPPE